MTSLVATSEQRGAMIQEMPPVAFLGTAGIVALFWP